VLEEEGRNSSPINHLLNDAQQWSWLYKSLRLHVTESEKVLRDFKENEVLLSEVRDFERKRTSEVVPGSSTQRNAEDLEAIRQLSEKINELDRSCCEKIRELERRTGEMIENC
jgi:hypothetical protein